MSDNPYFAQIKESVTNNDIVIYMKGTAEIPMCGFSGAVVSIFDHLGADFEAINVLDDMGLRQAIKEYNDWPTIPQIFVKGEFIGGCDIIREMFEAGELQELLKQKGLLS